MAKRKQEEEEGTWVSVEAQREQGLRRNNLYGEAKFVAPQAPVVKLSAEDMPMPVVQAQPVYLPEVPQSTKTGHVRHIDDPMTNARATLLYGHVIGFWGFLALSAIIIYLLWQGNLALEDAGLSELVALAVCMLAALVINRNQGLHHSATGIAHHEIRAQKAMHKDNTSVEKERIASQERVAMHAIDKHAELLEKRWDIEQRMNQKRLPGE